MQRGVGEFVDFNLSMPMAESASPGAIFMLDERRLEGSWNRIYSAAGNA